MARLAQPNERGLTLMVTAQRTKLTELNWLTDVSESRQPLDELRPIWVRHGTVHSGPSIPHPEHHPYCEFGTHLLGELVLFVEGEQSRRLPGDLFLTGPGVPHWSKITCYPVQFITVYFLPNVLIQQGPEQDGTRMLRRFTAPQTLSRRLVRPSPDLLPSFIRGFEDMVGEFENPQIGTEMRLRTILVEMLVRLLRWEHGGVESLAETGAKVDWQILSRALHYLHAHFTEPIYARDVTAAAGVCQTRLELMFREALGISWVHFLQGYRIERAAALLSDPRYRVVEAAMAVGFESLSHFNATFRTFMRVSPTTYQKKALQKSAKANPSTVPAHRRAGEQNSDPTFPSTQIGPPPLKPMGSTPANGAQPEKQRPTTIQECSLCNRTFRRVDMSHVQLIDCNLEGMTINGVQVSALLDAHRKTMG